MILVDTSVWIDHLKRGVPALSSALAANEVATHPFVIGELLCGNLRPESDVGRLIQGLPTVPVALDAEVLTLIRFRQLRGRGVGYLDMHLLASAMLADCRLWTVDQRLRSVADELNIAAPEAADD